MTRFIVPLAALTLAAAAPALAVTNPGNPVVLDRAAANDCRMILADVGKAMVVQASGLIPGETYRFTLTNGDMKPIDFAAYADAGGSLVHYYVPFRFGQDGGVVRVRVIGATCTLAAAAEWTREVPVIR